MKIAIIQAHPDNSQPHYCHALMQAYAKGAAANGHSVKTLNLTELDFPLLRSEEDWKHGQLSADIEHAQETLVWAEHWVICYPLWLGTMPALLKAFLEQVLRPGFAVNVDDDHAGWQRLLRGKSCRIVITMGMPALVYRWVFRAHSLKSLERNILKFCGLGPIKESLVGLVAADNDRGRTKALKKMRTLGAKAV